MRVPGRLCPWPCTVLTGLINMTHTPMELSSPPSPMRGAPFGRPRAARGVDGFRSRYAPSVKMAGSVHSHWPSPSSDGPGKGGDEECTSPSIEWDLHPVLGGCGAAPAWHQHVRLANMQVVPTRSGQPWMLGAGWPEGMNVYIDGDIYPLCWVQPL